MDTQTGRPSKYTKETVSAILEKIRYGCTKTEAASACGIHRDTLNEWEHEYPEFAEAVERAEAEQIVGMVAMILGAGAEDWRATAWLLERRHPELFSLNPHFKTKEPVEYEFTGERAEAVLDLARSILAHEAKEKNTSSSNSPAS